MHFMGKEKSVEKTCAHDIHDVVPSFGNGYSFVGVALVLANAKDN
jgi:hypothetical protein